MKRRIGTASMLHCLPFRSLLLLLLLLTPLSAHAIFTIKVVDAKTGAAVNGFRWLAEEDNTTQTEPGVRTAFSVETSIHKSHAPVAANGRSNSDTTLVNVPGDRPYFVSVMPDAGYALGGARIDAGKDSVTVVVNQQGIIPTAQISIFAFNDNRPINNAYDMPDEQGLGGFNIQIDDAFGGGPVSQDAFGNPLGTVYQQTCDAAGNPTVPPGTGTFFCKDAEGSPVPTGVVLPMRTMTAADVANPAANPYGLKVGEALVKNLYPGKYGVKVIAPLGQPNWQQTSTIEGTPVIDAWVKSDEPRLFVEGFGTGTHHVQFGFVDPTTLPWAVTPPPAGGSMVSGQNVYNHFSRPPTLQGYFPGVPVPECWVGLNDPVTKQGLYAAACDANSFFSIPNVPAGTWQLVTWDKPLGALFGVNTLTVPAGGAPVDLGKLFSFKWFGHLEGSVFYDDNENGFRDPGEPGIAQQAINLRFRDGSIYQSTITDSTGEYVLPEVFPFFKWLIAEVDFARFKATGMTAVVDNGGEVLPHNGWTWPSFDKLTPQPQAEVNPNTGNNLSRTETGPVLLQAMHLFLGQANVIDWGKKDYALRENGGIAGIVYYAVTRAENDARLAAPEVLFEPGIPRVQVNLYRDVDADGVIDDINGDGKVTLTDVDNYPFQWAPEHRLLPDGSTNPIWTDKPGSEDVDRDGNGRFNYGDAVNIAWTDSFDDNTPTGCIQTLPQVDGVPIKECADSFGTWNQVRPGVFDGGYAFTSYFPLGMETHQEVEGLASTGAYIVEAVPPRSYQIQKEEDKNVDFGDSYTPSLKVTPPVCVGDPHVVPPYLTLFPDQQIPALYAGQTRPLCDRRQVIVLDRINSAADFFMFTEVPKAARAVGFALNDLSPEFDVNSPVFGEKSAPGWLPISFQDFAGNEVYRTYTDEYGAYNGLLPSTFSTNLPSPSGLAPQMATVFLNHPFMPDPASPGNRVLDPHYDPSYSQMAWTFMYTPGKTSYLDTPILPVAAFVGHPNFNVDAEPPNGTPKIHSVTGDSVSSANQKGPIVCADGDTITIKSPGERVEVPNPDFSNLPGNTAPRFITRDFGFGAVRGSVKIVYPAPDGSFTGAVSAELEVVSWGPDTIKARVPAGAFAAGLKTGQLMVFRGDNARWTETGITLHAGGCASVIHVAQGGSIQAAIDAVARPGNGELIMVPPGVYNEAVIIDRNVRLQGWGAESTSVYAYPNPLTKLADWHAKVKGIIDAAWNANPGPSRLATFPTVARPFVIDPVTGLPVVDPVTGQPTPIDVLPDTALTFAPIEMPGFLLLIDRNIPVFSSALPGLIDGFTINGSISGGGVQVFDSADFLQISNNRITGNQGTRGGGIVTGQPDGVLSLNPNVFIHHNHIAKNAGITEGGGGISVFNGTDNYRIIENRITGNFSRWHGGGIAHSGLSDGGVIENNRILFNEVFFGTPVIGTPVGGEGGGIYIAGEVPPPTVLAPLPVVLGTGSLTVNGNLIQGNLAGAGDGGGIRVVSVNGDDVLQNPANTPPVDPLLDPVQWYELNIFNNIIVNNVSGFAGGGISLQDVVQSNIVNNTIANNDSTSTALSALIPGTNPPLSSPRGAGLVTHAHSPVLFDALTGAGSFCAANPTASICAAFSNPLLTNNIIWQNRSFSWNGAANNNQGGLVPNPAGNGYQDLEVIGTTGAFTPQNCILTGAVGADPAFRKTYFNDLLFGVVLDEGGNNISARYSPLTTAAGDYHIGAASSARGAGAIPALPPVFPYTKLFADIDSDSRAGLPFDIGADQYNGKGDVNDDGVVTVTDVLAALRYYIDPVGFPVSQPANLDVYPFTIYGRPVGGDGFNLLDVLFLLRRATGLVSW